MAQPRSIWRQVFVNFINSIKKDRTGVLIGKDHFGSEYYEFPSRTHRGKPVRWCVPVDNDNFEQEMPTEWEAWLRHRRKNPPTEEEIQINMIKMAKTIKNAKKIEKPKGKEEEFNKGTRFPVYDDFEAEPGSNMNKKQQS